MYAKIETNSSNDGSDSDSSQDSCDSNVNDDEDDSSSENITSLMLTMALVPTRTDLSDHSSDDEIYECISDSGDEYHDADSGPTIECKCSHCPPAKDTGSYCCNEISVAVEIRESNNCITQIKQFVECIENVTVLELSAFSLNKGRAFPKEDEVEKFNKLMRHTAYRTFLHILDFRGLGTGRRFRLPACVEHTVRSLYPSPSGQYTGFHGLDQVNSLKEF